MSEALDPEDVIYRRILPVHFVPDSNTGRMRPSSAAFERRPDEEHASCYIHSLLLANDLVPTDALDQHAGFGLVSAPVDCLRQHDCDAVPDPNGVDPNHPHKCDPAHGALLEPSGSVSGIKKNWRKFARHQCVSVLHAPPPP